MAAVFCGLTAPIVIRSHKNPDLTEAVSNARQLGLALFEFENEYGKYPDASTIAAVKRETAMDLDLGTKSSNDFFRQLLAAGFTSSEKMFYAKIDGVRKPDDNFTKAEALKKGECGFSYLSGLSMKGNPSRPIAVTPLIPGTDRFDPTKFDGYAIILIMDTSVSTMPIGKDGHVLYGGKNLLDPTHPVWGKDDKFVIAWPEL